MARKEFPDNNYYGSVDDDPYVRLYSDELLENLVVDDFVKEERRTIRHGSSARRRRDNREHPWRPANRRELSL